jgi:hypothetical protein
MNAMPCQIYNMADSERFEMDHGSFPKCLGGDIVYTL